MSNKKSVRSLENTFEDAVGDFGESIKNIDKTAHTKTLKGLENSMTAYNVSLNKDVVKKYDNFVAVDKKIKTGSKVISENIDLSKMDNIITNIKKALEMLEDQSLVDNAGNDKFDKIRKNLNSAEAAVGTLKSKMKSFNKKLEDISG